MTEKDSNVVLRDFIYIDKERMYSLYSQLFEGVVESLVESVSYSNEEAKKDKKLEETIIDASVKVQNVVLFDHIYNTLEAKLQPQIQIIDSQTSYEDIKPNSIVKITGHVVIEDYEHLSYLMQNFNEIGIALATLTLTSQAPDKKMISKNTIDQYAKENGLAMDKKLCESIVKVIENLHGNSMEITIELEDDAFDVGFKALLEEQYLRLSTNNIRSLYGYKPCIKWTLVGEVTNISFRNNHRAEKNKTAFSKMFESLSEVDNAFSKINDSTNHIVRVAPIAVYIEHDTPSSVSE